MYAQRGTSLTDAPDRLLAQRGGEGDVRAFAVLIRRHESLLRVVARRVLGGTADVDDVVQEAFIAAWDQLPRLRNPDTFRGWLVRIASRKALDRVRARRDVDDIDDHLAVTGSSTWLPERIVVDRHHVQALSAALDAMPAEQQRCWYLREVAECSYAEIATELDMPVTTVRGILARARRNLMQQMEVWR